LAVALAGYGRGRGNPLETENGAGIAIDPVIDWNALRLRDLDQPTFLVFGRQQIGQDHPFLFLPLLGGQRGAIVCDVIDLAIKRGDQLILKKPRYQRRRIFEIARRVGKNVRCRSGPWPGLRFRVSC